ncbi:MAG: vWA domain-containing protein, partial [Sedimentibacter sp.]|uniref:vWA domain-containing protein n=1 Tax=Sedimentibacter sp. TaxID=1960295 RepID=UPI0029821BA9
MNKPKMFKKVICFVIALMMLMPSMPSNLVSAVSVEVGDNLSVDKTAYKAEEATATDKDYWVQFDINGEDTTIQPIPLDVVLVLDRSGSMKGNNRIGYLKTAAKNFIDKILENNTSNRVSILTFSDGDGGYTQTAFTNNDTTLKNAVNAMEADGDTNTGVAFERAKNLLDSANENSKKALVLFTDGAPAPRRNDVDYGYSKHATEEAREIQVEYEEMPMYCVYWDPNVGSGENFYLGDEIPSSDVENIGSNFYKEKTWNKTLDRERHWFLGYYYEHYLTINNSFILNTLLPTFVSKPEYLIKASTDLTQLESVFDGIAGSILSFASDVRLTDLVKKENFDLNIGTSDSVQYRSKVASGTNTNAWTPVSSVNTQPVYYTLGADGDANTADIQMSFDKISQPGIEVRFKIKLKDGVYSSETASVDAPDLDTNESANITYTDAIDTVHSNKNIPIFPKVFVPNPNVTAKIVKVDEAGNPLEGATFAVDKQGAGVERVAAGPANEGLGKNEFSFTIDTTNSSAYIIKEIIVPAGYENNDQFNVQLRSDGITLLGSPSSNISVDPNDPMTIIVENTIDDTQKLGYTVNYYKAGATEAFATASGEVVKAN